MLASLLPGLRDVRGPLASGYTWLFTLWLVFGDEIPDKRPSGDGLTARLFDLEAKLGSGAVLVTLSFLAYVLGSLLFAGENSHLRRRGAATRRIVGLGHLSPARLARTHTLAETPAEGARCLDPERFGSPHKRPRRNPDMMAILDARLRIQQPALYDDMDRLRAEAEFRLNFGIAAMVMITVVLVIVPGWWVLVLVALGISIFTMTAGPRFIAADRRILEAVRQGLVDLGTPEEGNKP